MFLLHPLDPNVQKTSAINDHVNYFYKNKYKKKLVILQSIGILVIKSKETRVITYTYRHSSGPLIPNSSWPDRIIGIKCPLEYRWSSLFPLLFITMIPIDCFSLYLFFFCFFWKITIIISWRAPNKILVENPLASTLHIHSFWAHYVVL